jgi:phage FluMu gp28-like protein
MGNDLITSVYEDDGTSPQGWVIKNPTEQDLIPMLSDPLNFAEFGLNQDYLDERAQGHGMPEWIWEEFQKAYFAHNGWYITNKARQTGASLAWAAKKTIMATLGTDDYTAVATSITKAEAQNKIQYVRQFLDAMPMRFKKKIIRDAVHLIEFENPNRTRAKILSHAQKPLRGVHGDVGFDELAFYQNPKLIYDSALPVVSQVRGHIDIISTPFGLGGMFHDIFMDPVKYPQFLRMPVMWWHCRRWLRDSSTAGLVKAFKMAPKMNPEERVYAFGSDALITQFQNLDLIIFRQEFEGHFIDELAAFFNKELILRCFVNIDDDEYDEYDPLDKDFNIPIEEALQKKKSVIEQVYSDMRSIDGRIIHFKKYDSLSSLYHAVSTGEISSRLYGGADIGTSNHASDFCIIEEIILHNSNVLQIERFRLNKQKWRLPDQQMYFSQVLQSGRLMRLGMDTTGLGVQMGQALTLAYPHIFKGYSMGGTGRTPNILMSNLKTRMDSLSIALQNSKQTLDDLYAIRRVVGESKNISFKADEEHRHHADGAWSTAIASYMGTPATEQMHEMLDLSNIKGPTKTVEKHNGVPRINMIGVQEHFDKQSGLSSDGFGMSTQRLGGFIPPTFRKNYDK